MPKVKYTKEKGLIQESGSSEQMAIFGSASSITAAGANQGAATGIESIVALATTSVNNNKGVRLPAGVSGAVHVIHNLSGVHSIKLYPATGEKIEGASGNKVIAAGTTVMCMYTGATRGWQRITGA